MEMVGGGGAAGDFLGEQEASDSAREADPENRAKG